MAESTQFRDRPLPASLEPANSRLGQRAWSRAKLIVSRSIFWSYQRGSWQYDLICAIILAFIFLTPAGWFHDRPTLGLTDLRNSQGIIEIGHAHDGWRYLLDARLVTSLGSLKLSDAAREVLEQRLRKSVDIKSITAVRDQHNVVLGYTVVVSRH